MQSRCQDLHRASGVADKGPVACEDFVRWVVEAVPPSPKPPNFESPQAKGVLEVRACVMVWMGSGGSVGHLGIARSVSNLCGACLPCTRVRVEEGLESGSRLTVGYC